MLPKKSVTKAKMTVVIILMLILTYFVLHCVHYSDVVNGKSGPDGITLLDSSIGNKTQGFNIGNIGGFGNVGAVVGGVKEAIFDPFNFNGLVLSHAFKPLIIMYLFMGLVLLLRETDKKAKRGDAEGKEHGSSKWNTDLEGFRKDFSWVPTKQELLMKVPDNNILLAEGMPMVLDESRKKDMKFICKRNKSVLVVAPAGGGKTTGIALPNIAQMNSSYVVTDPKGEILATTGKMLMENGYTIKVFSTSDMKYSDCYNPLDYIYDQNGVVDQSKVKILVSTFIINSQGIQNGAKGGDPFWIKSSEAWMTFAVLYLAEFCNVQDRNMAHVLLLAQQGKADENSSSSTTQLDKLVALARSKKPDAKCFSSYDTFNLAPAKTRNSILISIAVDLNPFSIDDVNNMTQTSYLCKRDRHGFIKEEIKVKGELIKDSRNIELDKIGDEKTALFINIPVANSAFNFLVALMYSQLFDTLYTKAEKICPNRWHIYDSSGYVLSSQYHSVEEAEHMAELFKTAQVKREEENGEEKLYIYNENAEKEYTLPQKAAVKKYGYLKEVYSEEIGNQIIKSYGSSSVQKGGIRFPIHIQLVLDEFKNIGRIPDFELRLATMRGYEMSAYIILQSLSQLKAMYKESWEEVVGNCDSKIFLGASDLETAKYISEMLGKATINSISHSMNKTGVSTSQQKLGRELLTPAEVMTLDRNKSIVIITNLKPFLATKTNWWGHPNFKYSGFASNDNKYNDEYMEKFHKCLPKQHAVVANATEYEGRKRSVVKQQIIPDGKGSRVSIKTASIRNKQELAKAMETTEEKVEQVIEDTPSVPEKDFAETTQPAFKQPDTEDINKNNLKKPDPEADTKPEQSSEETPEDSTWFFCE